MPSILRVGRLINVGMIGRTCQGAFSNQALHANCVARGALHASRHHSEIHSSALRPSCGSRRRVHAPCGAGDASGWRTMANGSSSCPADGAALAASHVSHHKGPADTLASRHHSLAAISISSRLNNACGLMKAEASAGSATYWPFAPVTVMRMFFGSRR